MGVVGRGRQRVITSSEAWSSRFAEHKHSSLFKKFSLGGVLFGSVGTLADVFWEVKSLGWAFRSFPVIVYGQSQFPCASMDFDSPNFSGAIWLWLLSPLLVRGNNRNWGWLARF